ncbi:MAG: hypothetical protein SFV23_21520 [Planctomycetaceae bacterium]|nr:hypothetical protein [Planctomycetaceae bacterium]
MIGDRPMCMDCRHLSRDPDAPAFSGSTCDAFPAGIPIEIFIDGFDHRKRFPGDNGIRFEPIEPRSQDATPQ